MLYLSRTDQTYPINYNIEGNGGLGPNNLNINLYNKDGTDQTYHKDRTDMGDVGKGLTNVVSEVLRRNSYYKDRNTGSLTNDKVGFGSLNMHSFMRNAIYKGGFDKTFTGIISQYKPL